MSVSLHISSPFLTPEKYAEMVGVSKGTIEGQIKNGHLPIIKLGKRNFINVALLTKQALEMES